MAMRSDNISCQNQTFLFSVRPAVPADLFSIAAVRVNTWQSAYRGILPDEFLDRLSIQDVIERWKPKYFESRLPGVEAFVAENSQKAVIAFAFCGPEPSQDSDYDSEIYTLYVLPQNQNQGVGRALFGACVRHLLQRIACQNLLVWVIAENPYRRFYEKLGGKPVRQKSIEIGGMTFSEIAYGWQGLTSIINFLR